MGKDSNNITSTSLNVPSELNMTSVDLNPSVSHENEQNKTNNAFKRRISSVSMSIQKVFGVSREEGDFTLGCIKVFHTRTRFLIMVLVLLCLASIWSNILAFNFAIICMNPKPANETKSNVTNEHSMFNPVSLTSNDKSLLTSAVAAAALISNFIVVPLIGNYGIRTIFALLGILSAISTFAMPWAFEFGFSYILALRVLQGIAFASNFPVIGAFSSKWTYYKQNGLFVSVLVAYVQLSPSLTLPISGALCTSQWGWPSVFYVHGVYCALLFIIYGFFYRNSPRKHPYVGDIELRKIAVGKSECSKEELKKIPYVPILKTAAVWAVWIAAIGNFTTVNMMFLFSPNYLNGVLGFKVNKTGISAAIGPIAQFLIKLFAGFTSDKIKCISESNKLRIYNSIAFLGSCTFLSILAFTPGEYPNACLMLLGISAGILGFTTGGFFKAGPLISKHYSHFVTGNVSLGITITMLIVPFVVGGLAPNNDAEGWKKIFLFTGAVLFITNLCFVIMSSAKPAVWTTDEFSRNASRNKVYSTQTSSRREFAPEVTVG
ncbi:Major facilitator superfamily and Major facilitator superfamily domain, general substrate transporter and Major facilitator superfamily domain-containing protein [Strongyloides ratti]|uniref:Major facilitator superfamily and Major facilitator superfamily domain, general substrate transporter and Major facilitator superfamily domain-containing protein n=1 Tax=Strongyloides ratti TaxID=34506 RepID=A0A090MRA1_STRRB|nr:Major facilitator superfamily and Major facilitator superfamily domain, general substrate transporter and Major facilitator superfamily domain-containing protein [Strongyloides ratti]CEF60718.1 Major facilitator superfamily and Major facilitator superfamily domain, general substrate transporter and Major facilitator superfamily domain-containing protein [Strongyloides ratti]